MPKKLTANPEFKSEINDFPVAGEPVDIEPIEDAFRVLLGNTIKTQDDLTAFRATVGQPNGVATLNERGELAQPLPDGSVTEAKLGLRDQDGTYHLGPFAITSSSEIDSTGDTKYIIWGTNFRWNSSSNQLQQVNDDAPIAAAVVLGRKLENPLGILDPLFLDANLTFYVGTPKTNLGIGFLSKSLTLAVGSITLEHSTFIDGGFIPLSGDVYTLGNESRPWKSLYVQDGVITTSDSREKENIQPSDLGLNFIRKLRPVRYTRRIGGYVEDGIETVKDEALGIETQRPKRVPRPGVRPHYGLIAQDVKAVMEELGVDFGGYKLADPNDPESKAALDYSQFIAPIIKAIQELAGEASALRERLERLERERGGDKNASR